MTIFLETSIIKPQEREYEAWVIQGIEEYFERLGVISYAIWAVSPHDEAHWPADEELAVGCKLVGLQFKQAKMADATPEYNRLKWTLHQPPGQFELVQKIPEIFYCLPTFVNRKLRKRALDHCLFWRPGTQIDLNVWYDNPAAHTPYKKVCDSMRWGRFIEAVLSCEIGVKVTSVDQANKYIRDFSGKAREAYVKRERSNQEENGKQANDITYFIAIQYEG